MDFRSPHLKADRPFTLLDAMILVGSAALGMGVTRWLDPTGSLWALIKAIASNFAWEWNLFDQAVPGLLIFAMPAAVTMTLGVLALRLRKPRPRWRRLARQPGIVAYFALALSWVAAGAYAVVGALSNVPTVATPATAPGLPPGTSFAWVLLSYHQEFTVLGSVLAGFAVVVAWATMILVGRWRPEPTWLDRLGRLVGVAWMGMALAGWFAIRTGFL